MVIITSPSDLDELYTDLYEESLISLLERYVIKEYKFVTPSLPYYSELFWSFDRLYVSNVNVPPCDHVLSS